MSQPQQSARVLPLNRKSLARGLNNHAELIEAFREELLAQRNQIGALIDGQDRQDARLDALTAPKSFLARLRWLFLGH